jgi:hypothetical protein
MYLLFIWRLDLMIVMGANPLLGPLEGWALKILTFLGQNGTSFARGHFRAQKSLDFKSPPLPMALEMDFPPSKSLQVHWYFYVHEFCFRSILYSVFFILYYVVSFV